jgi:hypothetical protein
MRKLVNFFRNFSLLFLDTEKFISIFVSRIPKEKFLEILREYVQQEKREKIGEIMHTISAQKHYIEQLEKYEKMLDVEKKNEGDFVTIWDFTSASYVEKNEKNEYVFVESLAYLSPEEKENFGKLMVYDTEYRGTLSFEDKYMLIQDLILSSIKDNKLIAINSLHTKIV